MSIENSNKDCGCCTGINAETPVVVNNHPSLSAIQYRIGTHAQFKESMLAALSSANNQALGELSSRDNDDFSIALLDSVATTLDVLTFYTERYFQENYLNTANERLSVVEMARLIGYQPAPGVAASTALAFTLQETPGIPLSPLEPITIAAGTQVQSVPGQDEMPQVFETTKAIEARPEWNSVSVQTTIPWHPLHGDVDLHINGISNILESGDAILIVGADRIKNAGSERWDVRVLSAVEEDKERGQTRLIWDAPLGHSWPGVNPAEQDVQVFVFRKRVGLFGNNAPDPRLMSIGDDTQLGELVNDPESGINMIWDNYSIQNEQIDLDASYKKVVADSWVALLSNNEDYGTASLPGYLELYRVKKVFQLSRSAYGLSSKITRIKPDTTENLDSRFGLKSTLVFAESEQLISTARPVWYPLYGIEIKLAGIDSNINPGHLLSVTGKPQFVVIAAGVNDLILEHDEGSTVLREGDRLMLKNTPEKIVASSPVSLRPIDFAESLVKGNDLLRLVVIDRDNKPGILNVKSGDIILGKAEETDKPISEIIQINSEELAVSSDRDRTQLKLMTDLANVYQRDTVRINFNVVTATHGETVEEILGNGDARLRDQVFSLKQTPLTYTSANTASGRQSSMEVRVNDLRWQQTESLYQQAKDSRVYKLQQGDGARTSILFGDGVEGSRLPSGMTNVRARYRKGIGLAANLSDNKLTTLLTKPLGVSEVTNPVASTGGEDPENRDDARSNAPLIVLTLGRAVSEKDYQDFTRAFAGVAKAHALWIHSGPSRGIFITVSGIGGAEISGASETYTNLVSSLRANGDPLLPLTVSNYRTANFSLALAVKVSIEAETEIVLSNVENVIRDCFSFGRRDFGQNVSQDEILAVAHSVDHVEAVHITKFYKNAPGVSLGLASIVAASLPVASLTETPEPAQLLLLADEPLQLEVLL